MVDQSTVSVGSKVRIKHQKNCPYMTVVELNEDGFARCVWFEFEDRITMLETIVHRAALVVYNDE